MTTNLPLPRALLSAACMLLAFGTAGAVTITAPKTSDTATVAKCKNNTYKDCKSTAHVDKATPLKGDNASFKSAFDQWNGLQAAGSKWTLHDGGALPGGNFTVSQFMATATADFGGMSIIVDWSYAGADKADYLWSQGLSLNYKPGDGVDAKPANTSSFALDTDSFSNLAGCNNKDTATSWSAPRDASNYYCGPAYTYQTGERQLGDAPKGPWPNASFEAYALVSKLDRANRKLTLYEGIEYGFVLSATAIPEPATWALMAAGLIGIGLARRARAMRATTA